MFDCQLDSKGPFFYLTCARVYFSCLFSAGAAIQPKTCRSPWNNGWHLTGYIPWHKYVDSWTSQPYLSKLWSFHSCGLRLLECGWKDLLPLINRWELGRSSTDVGWWVQASSQSPTSSKRCWVVLRSELSTSQSRSSTSNSEYMDLDWCNGWSKKKARHRPLLRSWNHNAASNIICCSREISLYWDDNSEPNPRKAAPGRKPEMYVNVQYQRREEIGSECSTRIFFLLVTRQPQCNTHVSIQHKLTISKKISCL